MLIFLYCIFTVSIDTVTSRQSNQDINRDRLLPHEGDFSHSSDYHDRRSVLEQHQIRTNDYDDHSSGYYRIPPSLQSGIYTKSTAAPLKIHQPKEDPRLFYQSNTYLKANNGENVNQDVSFIYPGREVIRASDESSRPMSLRIDDGDVNLCIQCPHGRTLVTRHNSNMVALPAPRLFLCSGQRAPNTVKFVRMYGPDFGTLLGEGSHTILGRITYNNKSIHLCKMQVKVISQGCATPKHLISHCEGRNCTFKCRNPKSILYGKSSMMCGSHMKWTEALPVCRVRTWCEPPIPPEQGRISCKDASVSDRFGPGLSEGSKCRVHCPKGWHWYPRAVTVCRRGVWTNALSCQKKLLNT